MNNGNGGPTGIQTWTIKYRNTVPILLQLLSEPTHTLKIVNLQENETYLKKLSEYGVVIRHGDSTYTLDLEKFAAISAVVPDDMYDNFMDINWLREQRKKLGLIESDVKGEEFRRKQQERRRRRREYAKKQRAKRLAQPPEELPLSSVVFVEPTDPVVKVLPENRPDS